MKNKRPRTIEVVLLNGEPAGIRTAALTTSIIKLFEIPRNDLVEFCKLPEAKQVGLYFLISGENNNEVYIGQSGEVGKRLLQHHKENNKEWERALVIVSLTNNLTQTHVLYLESSSIEHAKFCQRYELLNSNLGQKPHAPLPLKSDCDEIHEINNILLATLGYPIFEPMAVQSNTEENQIFYCYRSDVNAKAIYSNEGMVVLKGSSAPMNTNRKTEQRFFDKRNKLLNKGVIKIEGNRFVFQRDHLFKTPSGASMFLLLATSNGWVDWKTNSGMSLKEFVAREI